jgi:hypothetical protein
MEISPGHTRTLMFFFLIKRGIKKLREYHKQTCLLLAPKRTAITCPSGNSA